MEQEIDQIFKMDIEEAIKNSLIDFVNKNGKQLNASSKCD